MSDPIFDKAFHDLIGNEGGYSNNPADPGGETMWGITKRVAVANGYTGPMIDLPLETAKEIAKSEYWTRYGCEQYDPHVAFQVFDAAYNGGHPVEWLQEASGSTIDGVLGPNTIAAVNSVNPYVLVMRFDAYRLKYLDSLRTWPSFGRGWVIRIANNLLIAAN